MKKYRRIEVNAFRRRVTVISGEWRPGDPFDAQPALAEDEVSLNNSDESEAVATDSPEGQMILVGAIQTLKRRLWPEARAMVCDGQNTLAANGSNRNGFHFKLQSFYQFICPRALRFGRKEK